MKKARKYKVAGAAILLALLIIFVKGRYDRRPPFAGGFYIIGDGFIANWEDGPMVSISGGRDVFIDIHENVMLLVWSDGSHSIEWVPAGMRDRNLVIRRLSTGSEREIEWRRDCLIVVRDGNPPQYFSLPVSEFKKAIDEKSEYLRRIEKIVDEICPQDRTVPQLGTHDNATTDPEATSRSDR